MKLEPRKSPGQFPQGGMRPQEVRRLISLAADGLRLMFDRDEQLFCHRFILTSAGCVQEGLSPRYSVMTLLGLKKLEAAGIVSLVDMEECFQTLLRNTDWVRGVGDLGLLIWMTAIFKPDQVEALLQRFCWTTALQRYRDSRQARTMELAWFLTGLAYAARLSPNLAERLTDTCVDTYHRLRANQGEHGFFGHMGSEQSLVGRMRGHIGSFADQVYPIFAMSKLVSFLHVEEAIKPALECGNAICLAQGNLGQWWWLYDSHHAKLSSGYPVYSVHQHGMAPMALFALAEVTGICFDAPIFRGLEWIYGTNELSLDMRDSAHKTIWRCQQARARQSKYWSIASSVWRSSSTVRPKSDLEVLHEQRPYEYGWLLFAFARHSIFA
jgi:hypothetical protein